MQYLRATQELLSDIIEEIYAVAAEEINPHDNDYEADEEDFAKAKERIGEIIESRLEDESFPITSTEEW